MCQQPVQASAQQRKTTNRAKRQPTQWGKKSLPTTPQADTKIF